MGVVGEMPPVAMLEVGDVMSASQVSWAFQRMHMRHDCFHEILRALGMIEAKSRHLNRIVPAANISKHPFGMSLCYHPERKYAKYKDFRRHGYGDWFVRIEDVHELRYAHVHFFVYGLRIL